MKESQGLFKIIKRSFLWLTITGLVTIGAITIFFLNFRPSIEFTGGIQLSLNNINNQETLVDNLTKSLTEK